MIIKSILAFGAGFISFLTPCVLPIIPGYISYISGKPLPELEKSKNVVLLKTIIFSLGFSLVFITLGAAASAIGNVLLFFSKELRIFAGVLIISKIFFSKNFLKFFLQTAFQLNEIGWNKLNFRWAYFFIFLAILNEIVWRTQPETTWVNCKVWGILPITFIFTAFQVPLINKYKI